MAESIKKVSVGAALTRIEFTDDDGILCGFLKINLTDIRLAKRLEDIAEYFSNYQFSGDSAERLQELDKALVQKFSYLLGYDCETTLFGVLSPTSITGSGEIFANFVIHEISEVFDQQIKEKAAARAAAMKKHTEKYERV